MSGKARRRREARRRAQQRRAEQTADRLPQDEDVAEDAGTPVEEPLHASAPEAAHGRAARKRAKRRAGPRERMRRLRVSPWLIGTPIVGTVVVVLGFLILTSGSSGTTGGGAAAMPTPDPRVAGAIDESFEITGGDSGASVAATTSFFQPSTVTGDAGDGIEFVLTNTGSVTHNIWVAGPDNEYDTADDFGPIDLIKPGETGRLLVKIEEPGTYSFRCQIHPEIQTGELILE